MGREMTDKEETQDQAVPTRRIHLQVDGLRLPLTIPAQEERYYRQGRDIIEQGIRLYRSRYPSLADLPEKAYAIMGAIDLGRIYAYQREQMQTDEVTPRLRQLNERAERLIRQIEDKLGAQEP